MTLRVGMHLGPFYASTSLGGRPRRARPSGGGPVALLLIWMFQLIAWTVWGSLIACYWTIKLMWVGGLWIAGKVQAAVKAKQAEQARQREATLAAAERAHAEVLASLHPEDVQFLKANGWAAPDASVEKAS